MSEEKLRIIISEIAYVFLLLFIITSACAETPHSLVKKGNKHVVNGELDEALTKYLEARATRDSTRPELQYDLGGVYARSGDLMKADSILRSLPPETRESLLARAEYNRGTALAKGQQYDQALAALIDALKMDPKDMDAKTNLELIRRMIQQQEQQQQQNQDQKDQEKKEDQKQQQQQQQQDQQQQDQQQQEEQQPQPQPNEQDEMDRKLAERFLDKLQQDEKELLKQVVQQQIPREKKKVKKDW